MSNRADKYICYTRGDIAQRFFHNSISYSTLSVYNLKSYKSFDEEVPSVTNSSSSSPGESCTSPEVQSPSSSQGPSTSPEVQTSSSQGQSPSTGHSSTSPQLSSLRKKRGHQSGSDSDLLESPDKYNMQSVAKQVRTPGSFDISGSSDGEFDRGTKSYTAVYRGSKTAKQKKKSPLKKKNKKLRPLTDKLPAEKVKIATKSSKKKKKNPTPDTSYSSS